MKTFPAVDDGRRSTTTATALLRAWHPQPPQLATLLALIERSSQPMFIAWGPELRLLYNDAYLPILGERHPAAFGQPCAQVWAEAMPSVAPILQRVQGGESYSTEEFVVELRRDGRPPEAHFAFSFTPIVGPGEAVEGIFCVCSETTDGVLMRRARERESSRLQTMFANAPGFICILRGADQRFEFVNAAYQRLVGERPLIGVPVREAFPDLAGQGYFEMLESVYATGERVVAYASPLSIVVTPGQPAVRRFLDFVYEPIRDDDGSVGGIFVEGSDVTPMVLAHAETHAAERRNQELLEAMTDGFIVLDEEFRLVQINAQGERMEGRAKATMLGRTHWELWPLSRGTAVEAAYRKVMAERLPIDLRHHYDDGLQDQWLHLRIYPVSGGIACLYRDITAEMGSDNALRESQQRFAAAVAAIGVMWTNDADGRMVGRQIGWEQLTGQTEAEYQGYGWSQAVHPDDAAGTVSGWNAAVAQRRVFQHEHRIRRRDGQWRQFSIRAVPVIEHDGRVREWVGVHIDVTEAAEATRALREADRKKDEFIATLAHELRNPLAPVRNAAHLLRLPNLPADKLAWCAELIGRQVRTMSVLLDDLLDISRITTGRLELRRRYVAVEEVVAAAVDIAKPLLDAKRHRFDLSIEEGLPLLDADPVRVEQILGNLLVNAAKYTDAGGAVRLQAQRVGHEVEFAVTDTGIGLRPDALGTIFAMFNQVREAREHAEGGLGIGLALTKGLVELHGGSIVAKSAGLGKGSTFVVRLPSGAPQVADSRAAETVGWRTSAHRCTVLVVDDNEDSARTLSALLEIEGYTVQVAHDAAEAMRVAERSRPQVGLLDIGLPGESGHELAVRLRATAWGDRMSLAAITGWGREDDRRRATAVGFDMHFTKPVDPDLLLQWLAEATSIDHMVRPPSAA